jgi:hypothetical protein
MLVSILIRLHVIECLNHCLGLHGDELLQRWDVVVRVVALIGVGLVVTLAAPYVHHLMDF